VKSFSYFLAATGEVHGDEALRSRLEDAWEDARATDRITVYDGASLWVRGDGVTELRVCRASADPRKAVDVL